MVSAIYLGLDKSWVFSSRVNYQEYFLVSISLFWCFAINRFSLFHLLIYKQTAVFDCFEGWCVVFLPFVNCRTPVEWLCWNRRVCSGTEECAVWSCFCPCGTDVNFEQSRWLLFLFCCWSSL